MSVFFINFTEFCKWGNGEVSSNFDGAPLERVLPKNMQPADQIANFYLFLLDNNRSYRVIIVECRVVSMIQE